MDTSVYESSVMVIKGNGGRILLMLVTGYLFHGFHGNAEPVKSQIQPQKDAGDQNPDTQSESVSQLECTHYAQGHGGGDTDAQLGQPDQHIEFFHSMPPTSFVTIYH
jgi:hypothetical protein